MTLDNCLVTEGRRTLGVSIVRVFFWDTFRVQSRHRIHRFLATMALSMAGGAIVGVTGLGRRSARHRLALAKT